MVTCRPEPHLVIDGDELEPAECQEVNHLIEAALDLELIFEVQRQSLYINFFD